MPYIAKYSANNGPVQYVDSNNNVNFVGYAQSAENLTSAFYIRSTLNISALPVASSYWSYSNDSNGVLFVSLAQNRYGLTLANTLLSSVDTFKEYVDVLWYEDSGTDYALKYESGNFKYYFTKFNNEIPSALARGYANTAECTQCTCSSYTGVTGDYSTTGKIGIICLPPNGARAGYFVCVKKKDFDPTNVMFNTKIKHNSELNDVMRYNRLLAYNMTYKCNENTEFRAYYNGYMYIDCTEYNTVQNVKITYDTVPSQSISRGITNLIISPVSSYDSNFSAIEVSPTKTLKNIDLISNFSAVSSQDLSLPNIQCGGSYLYYSRANLDVVDRVSAVLGNYEGHTRTDDVYINTLSNTNCSLTFYDNMLNKVMFNCDNLNVSDYANRWPSRIADDCAIVKSRIKSGNTYDAMCNVNYKLIDSSAIYTNLAEWAIAAVNQVNFEKDIINSNITANQNGNNPHDNVLHLHFSAANYENVKVDLSGQKYTVGGDPTIYNNPDSFEITLPASAQTAFSFSSNDVPYTITTY